MSFLLEKRPNILTSNNLDIRYYRPMFYPSASETSYADRDSPRLASAGILGKERKPEVGKLGW